MGISQTDAKALKFKVSPCYKQSREIAGRAKMRGKIAKQNTDTLCILMTANEVLFAFILQVLTVGNLYPPQVHYSYVISRPSEAKYKWKTIAEKWSYCNKSCQGNLISNEYPLEVGKFTELWYCLIAFNVCAFGIQVCAFGIQVLFVRGDCCYKTLFSGWDNSTEIHARRIKAIACIVLFRLGDYSN